MWNPLVIPACGRHHRISLPTPTASELLTLHRRLLDGDPVVTDELAHALLMPLQEMLRCSDVELKNDAVTDALIDYFRRPHTFNPSKGSLQTFLIVAAKRNLINLGVSAARRKKREEKAGPALQKNVELRSAARNVTWSEPSEAEAFHRRLLAALAPGDRLVAELQLGGERRTAVFAEALGLTLPPGRERTAAVKRAKDRVNVTRSRLKG